MIGHGIGACPVLATGWPGFALLPGSAHTPLLGKSIKTKSGLIFNFCFAEIVLSLFCLSTNHEWFRRSRPQRLPKISKFRPTESFALVSQKTSFLCVTTLCSAQLCLVAVKVERGSAKGVPSATVKFCGTTSRVSPNQPSAVWPAVGESREYPVSSTRRPAVFSRSSWRMSSGML